MSIRIFLFLILTTASLHSIAQFKVKGRILGNNAEPLAGVSITVKDTYYGTTSTNDGSFNFSIPDSGTVKLVFSFTSYKTMEKQISISSAETSELLIVLKEEITEMNAVVVNAGRFEAGDKKRSTVLKSIDMVTIAGQQADIIAALKTLPGAQQVGETEGLFVRGGMGNETKVYIDGMMVSNPFYSSVPGIAQRSRYSPLLFKGTVFSSGAYSAQYGQGLSSVLLLESIDLPSRSEINLIISSAQQSVIGQNLNASKNRSSGFSINYSNLSPYFNIVSQKYNYSKAPETFTADFNIRKKFKNGMFKWYAYAGMNGLGFSRPSLDYAALNESFKLNNHHLFSNATYLQTLPGRWQLFVGTSVSVNKDDVRMKTGEANNVVSAFDPVLSNTTVQAKAVFTKSLAGISKLYVGAEHQFVKDGIEARDSISKRTIKDHFTSAFVEADIFYSNKLVSKAGLRLERSSLLDQMMLSPRLSVAYKLNAKSQVSLAFGRFFQKPETNYLLRTTDLDFSSADHFILNYQKVNNGQTFRSEVFYKKYRKLLTTGVNPFNLSNNGFGYAKGLEIFWRDKTSIKNLDYWVSYSFLDTKRKFMNYPGLVQPSFAAKHTLNIVAKRFFNKLSTQFSANYNFASGRPYYNPNKSEKEFMSEKTIAYHSLGLQANYLRTFGKVNAVFIVNVSNVLGTKQVYNYRFASGPDAQGQYNSEAITPTAKRFVFAGVYLSIGSDRRKEILD